MRLSAVLILYSLSLVGPVLCQEPPSQPVPLVEKEVPEMQVQGSTTLRLPSREITILRGSPCTLPDPVSPVPPAPEDPAAAAAWRAERAAIRLLPLSVTVYDHSKSHLRWTDPITRTEYEAWSNIDFNHIAGLGTFDAAGRKWELNLGLGNIDTTRIPPGTAESPQLPSHPALPANGPGFVVTKGGALDQAALAPVQALHDLYRAEGTALAAAYAERQRLQAEAEAWRRANPPVPQDNVMWFRPRKGSRYLQSEGGER